MIAVSNSLMLFNAIPNLIMAKDSPCNQTLTT